MSKKISEINIMYPKIKIDDLEIEYGSKRTFIEYKKYNLFISFIVDEDGIYLELFDSQHNNKEPRAPKGLALNYLYQIVRLIRKSKSLMKNVRKHEIYLIAGNIGSKHVKFNINKLKDYYRSIGFQFHKGGCDGRQSIESFLEIAKMKRKKICKVPITTDLIYKLLKQCDTKEELLTLIKKFRKDGIDNDLIDLVLTIDFNL